MRMDKIISSFFELVFVSDHTQFTAKPVVQMTFNGSTAKNCMMLLLLCTSFLTHFGCPCPPHTEDENCDVSFITCRVAC